MVNIMKLGENISYKFLEVGKEKTIVIIIDNFLASTAPLISMAKNRLYSEVPEECTYPGIRTPLTDLNYLTLVSSTISGILQKHGFINSQVKFTVDESTFSLLTTKVQDLDPNHCIPHFDGPEQNRLAVLHYLNVGDFGGTAFYRHRPTQFENITADKVEKYVESAQHFAEKHPDTRKGYFTKSSNHFELINWVNYVANRLVVYPVSLLHSAFIEQPEKNIDLDPEKGRLTTNIFVSAKAT